MADNADKDAGSQWEVAVRRQPPRFTKAQISAKRGRVLKQSHRPPPPPSYREEPKLPTLREGCEIDATVAPTNPEPVAQPPPHPPSDAPPHTPNPTVPPPNPSPVAPPHPPSDAPQSKPPPPNTSEVVATVPSPNPPPNPPPKKSVRGRAKHNNSSTVRPVRRSSRLNPLSTFLQDEPTDKGTDTVFAERWKISGVPIQTFKLANYLSISLYQCLNFASSHGYTRKFVVEMYPSMYDAH